MKKTRVVRSQKNTQSNTQSKGTLPLSLMGKYVTVYRGGPESKSGKLIDVQSDYITLYSNNNNNNNNNNDENNNNNNNNNNDDNNDNNTVIYYKAEHIKSISEDSKNNSMQALTEQEDDTELQYYSAENFVKLTHNFINKPIQINQGGPDSKYGTLLEVIDDYLVLYTEDDGVVFYNTHHIKSIMEYNEQNNDENGGQNNAANTGNEVFVPEYVRGTNFNDLFKNMTHSWVSINRNGPEALEGILVENTDGYFTLVNNQELCRVHPYHVRNISFGPKGAFQQNNNNNNNNNDNNQNNNNQQNDYDYEESSSSDDRYSSRSRSSSSSSDSRYSSRSRSSSRRSHRRSTSRGRNRSTSRGRDRDRGRTRTRSRSRTRSRRHDTVVKSVDYVWKSKTT